MFEQGLVSPEATPMEEMQATMDNHRELIENFESLEQVKLYKILKKLQSNREFKKLIGEVYLKNEATRLVHLKAHEAMNNEKSQRFLDNQITGVGCLNQFFLNIESAYEEACGHVAYAKEDLALMENEMLAYEREVHEEMGA